MKQASNEATVLLYSLSIDPFLEDLAKGADRVLHFEERPRDPYADYHVAGNEGSYLIQSSTVVHIHSLCYNSQFVSKTPYINNRLVYLWLKKNISNYPAAM
jgi:hypothetical protein